MKELGLARYGRVCGARHLPSHPNFAIASASTGLAWLLPPWPSSFISTEHLLGAWSTMVRRVIRRGNEIYL